MGQKKEKEIKQTRQIIFNKMKQNLTCMVFSVFKFRIRENVDQTKEHSNVEKTICVKFYYEKTNPIVRIKTSLVGNGKNNFKREKKEKYIETRTHLTSYLTSFGVNFFLN